MVGFLRRYRLQLLIICGIVIIVFLPYLLNIRLFLFNADQQLQYNYFYKEWMRLIKVFIHTGSFPFYSFNTFLGSNFFSSKFYYVTGDIFFPIMLIFSKFIQNIDFNLEIMSVFYVILSGFSFYLFLYKFGFRNKWLMLISSMLYSFSGIASNYVGQYMFHRFYSLLPLLFASVEQYRLKKSLSPFAFIVFILILNSYYFMFPTCIYLVIYFIFTYFYHEEDVNITIVLKKSIPLIGSFLIGLVLSSILAIPGLLFLKDNTRIGQLAFQFVYDFRVYLGYIFSFITSPLTLFSKYDYLFHVGHNGHLTWYSIYIGTAATAFLFSLFFIKNNLKITYVKRLVIFINVLALVPFFSSIMHGFSEPSFRWVFLIVFTHILSFTIIFDNFDIFRNEIVKGGILYVCIFLVISLISFLTNTIKIFENPIHLGYALVSFTLFIIFIGLIKMGYKRLIMILLMFEIIITFSARLWVLSETYYCYEPSLNEQAIKYFDDLDEELFYRIYVDPSELLPTSTMNLNQSINMNYYSTVTYDSTYEYILKDFLEYNKINWHIVNINNMDVLRMLGIKYYYVSDISKLPSGFEWEYKYNINHYQVFELKNHRSIGFTYSQFKSNNTIDANEGLDWINQLIVEDSLYQVIKNMKYVSSTDFVVSEFSDNRIVGSIDLEQEQMLFMSIPYNSGWKVMVNNQFVETYKVQGGFIGIRLNSGYHEIVMQFTPPGFKVGAMLSIIGFILLFILLILDIKKRNLS